MIAGVPQRTECQGLFGWMFGHKMVARYHTQFPERKLRITGTDQSDIEALKEKRYVCEVCIRCGRTIDLR